MAFEPTIFKNLVLALSHLNQIDADIRVTHSKLIRSESSEMAEIWFEILFSQIRSYNYLYLLLYQQIGFAINADHLNFYEHYQVMESLGIFITSAEKQTIKLLENLNNGQATMINQLKLISSQLSSIETGINSINNNIVSLTNSVISLENCLKDGFTIVSKKLDNMTDKISFGLNGISSQLSEMHSSLNYNNLIATVGAYQTYRVNQKITKLLNL